MYMHVYACMYICCSFEGLAVKILLGLYQRLMFCAATQTQLKILALSAEAEL
jgi:hypothetical protein